MIKTTIALSGSAFSIIFFLIWVIGVLMYIFYTRKYRLLRTLKKHPDCAINSVKNEEYVKIVGKALHANELLHAPLSGRPCILYHVIVRQRRSKGSSTKILEVVSSGDFFIERQGDVAIVNVVGNRHIENIYLKREVERTSGFLHDAKPEMEAFLEMHGKSSKYWVGLNKSLEYEEGIISSGEQIAVLGNAQWKGLKAPIEGYGYSKILTLSGNEHNKLIVTDLEKAVRLKNNLIERN